MTDCDCTCYFWERKLFTFSMGVVAGSLVAYLTSVTSKQTFSVALVLGVSAGLLVWLASSALISESYCVDQPACCQKLSSIMAG